MAKNKSSLQDILYFLEVAKRCSFSDASRELDVPLSTLSRRVAVLESQLQFKLLSRSTRKLELTAAGKVYYTECAAHIENARAVHEAFMQARIPRNPLGSEDPSKT